MQSDEELFSRRRFMQWGISAGAAAGAQFLLPTTSAQAQPAVESAAAEATRPAHSILLRNAELEIMLDADRGLPYKYRLLKNDSRLDGENSGALLTVMLCRRDPWTFETSGIRPESHEASRTSVGFRFRPSFQGIPAAHFALRYRIHGLTLEVTLEDIEELSGFELIEVGMPRLVSVHESDRGAWLAHGDQGGSFALLSEAKVGSLPPNTFWGSVLGTLPLVMVGTSDALCIQETTSFMDGTTLAVAGAEGARIASLGTIKVHRVNGSACYDLNFGRGAPRNCGNQNTPNLLVEQQSSCRLDFMTVSGDATKAWIAAGRLIRRRMPPIPTHFYDDKYVYGIRCDEPRFPKPSATFEQCNGIIARVAALTDHSPQVVHLWGWQFRGKDTGYPAVGVVNERIGGYDGMMRLMEQSADFNATVTLSDNYDDAYRSSPAWSDALIARRPDGQLWKSRSWTGEESYILGLAKYMDGPGPERIRYTCEHYRLRHTTHVDVLSYYAIRNDWDAEHPASGIRDLVDGRYKVLNGFAACGVDVSSEALRYPMIGHISCYWYLTGPAPCPFGGTAIPLVPLIYGGSAIWGLSGAGTRGDAATARILERFYGACAHSILRADSDASQFLDAFYLSMVPFFAMRGRNLEDFERKGDLTRIHLEGSAIIESNLAEKTLRVSLKGVEVLRGDTVFCPLGGSVDNPPKIACYSITPRTVSVSLPSGWSATEIAGATLYPERREKASFQLQGGSISIALEARLPVILYRNRSEARL
jgi:hypothetical protein